MRHSSSQNGQEHRVRGAFARRHQHGPVSCLLGPERGSMTWALLETRGYPVLKAISPRPRILLTEEASFSVSEGHTLLEGLLFLKRHKAIPPEDCGSQPGDPVSQGPQQGSLIFTPHPSGQNNGFISELILSPPSPFLVAMMT